MSCGLLILRPSRDTLRALSALGAISVYPEITGSARILSFLYYLFINYEITELKTSREGTQGVPAAVSQKIPNGVASRSRAGPPKPKTGLCALFHGWHRGGEVGGVPAPPRRAAESRVSDERVARHTRQPPPARGACPATQKPISTISFRLNLVKRRKTDELLRKCHRMKNL